MTIWRPIWAVEIGVWAAGATQTHIRPPVEYPVTALVTFSRPPFACAVESANRTLGTLERPYTGGVTSILAPATVSCGQAFTYVNDEDNAALVSDGLYNWSTARIAVRHVPELTATRDPIERATCDPDSEVRGIDTRPRRVGMMGHNTRAIEITIPEGPYTVPRLGAGPTLSERFNQIGGILSEFTIGTPTKEHTYTLTVTMTCG